VGGYVSRLFNSNYFVTSAALAGVFSVQNAILVIIIFHSRTQSNQAHSHLSDAGVPTTGDGVLVFSDTSDDIFIVSLTVVPVFTSLPVIFQQVAAREEAWKKALCSSAHCRVSLICVS